MGKPVRKSRAVVKAELMELVEKRIEEALQVGGKAGGMTFSEIEERVLAIREEVSVHLAAAMVSEQEKRQAGEVVGCPQCRAAMTYKDHHPLTVTSWVGVIEVERGYYHCAGCKRGFFPPR
jgi:hypothetical protein